MGKMIEINEKKHLNKHPDQINNQKASHGALSYNELCKSLRFIFDSNYPKGILALSATVQIIIDTIENQKRIEDLTHRIEKLEMDLFK